MKHIDLIYKKKSYLDLERRFAFMRSATILIGVVMALFLAVFSYLDYQSRQEYSQLLAQKQARLQNLGNKQDTISQLSLVNNKGQFLRSALAHEILFFDYYQKLSGYLPSSTNSGVVRSLSLDNARNINMTLSFSEYAPFSSFIGKLEDATFRDFFETLSVNRANMKREKTGEKYSVVVEGSLKSISHSP